MSPLMTEALQLLTNKGMIEQQHIGLTLRFVQPVFELFLIHCTDE